MSLEASLSTLPEAPTAPNLAADFDSVRPKPPREEEQDPNLLQIQLPIPAMYLETYPTLFFHPYHSKQDSKGTNVLAFLHNATKQELTDLVSVVIPALENRAKYSPRNTPLSESSGFGEGFIKWWKLLLRFFFFAAETNDEILKHMAEPVERVLQRDGDLKTLSFIRKQRKSVSDRHEFTMEVVFRAAERALLNLHSVDEGGQISKLVEKLEAVARFVLDTLQIVMNLGIELEAIAPGLEVSGLEYIIADNSSSFGKEDKSVFIYMCARWMKDEQYVRPWIIKYGGMWGRMMCKSWQKTHHEQRASVIEALLSKYLTPALSTN